MMSIEKLQQLIITNTYAMTSNLLYSLNTLSSLQKPDNNLPKVTQLQCHNQDLNQTHITSGFMPSEWGLRSGKVTIS